MTTEIATAVIQGATYKLAPRTLSVQKRIGELADLDKRYAACEITYEDALKVQIDFIKDVSGCTAFTDIALEDVDISDVECAVVDILNGYRNKVTREKLKSLNLTSTPPKRKKKKK